MKISNFMPALIREDCLLYHYFLCFSGANAVTKPVVDEPCYIHKYISVPTRRRTTPCWSGTVPGGAVQCGLYSITTPGRQLYVWCGWYLRNVYCIGTRLFPEQAISTGKWSKHRQKTAKRWTNGRWTSTWKRQDGKHSTCCPKIGVIIVCFLDQ